MGEPLTIEALGDPEIRVALRRTIREQLPTARIVDEVQVRFSRVDVASITEQFAGFEIKSWRDSLKRLDQQARDYSAVFDYCTLVATPRHMSGAEALVPEWWGLLLVVPGDGVTFSPIRAPNPNPALSVQALAMLLWREELRAILVAQGVVRGHSSAAKVRLAAMVHDCAPLPVVRAAIVRTLRERPEWRDDDGRAINRLTAREASLENSGIPVSSGRTSDG